MKVHLFCVRLAYNCAPFTVCFRRQNTEAFLEGLIQALTFFGGTPRRVLFDNARVAVEEGTGKTAIPQGTMRHSRHTPTSARASLRCLPHGSLPHLLNPSSSRS